MIALLFALVTAAPPAANPSPKSDLTPEQRFVAVQKRYDNFSDFSADFKQTLVRAARPGKGRSETGKVFLKRPGLMRWDYAEPEVKNFVIDGERLWEYKPDESQVMVFDKFHEAEVSAGLSFLWGKKTVLKEFTAQHYTGNDPLGEPMGASAIKLTPIKPDANVKSLVFAMDNAGFIAKAIVEDNLGNFNMFEFKNIKLDSGLKRDAFLFVPPEGVKVVHVE